MNQAAGYKLIINIREREREREGLTGKERTWPLVSSDDLTWNKILTFPADNLKIKPHPQ